MLLSLSIFISSSSFSSLSLLNSDIFFEYKLLLIILFLSLCSNNDLILSSTKIAFSFFLLFLFSLFILDIEVSILNEFFVFSSPEKILLDSNKDFLLIIFVFH